MTGRRLREKRKQTNNNKTMRIRLLYLVCSVMIQLCLDVLP